MTNTSTRREGGFTLIEILVVVTILGALMGMVAVIAPLAFGKRKVTTTTSLVQSVAVGLEQLKSPQMLGWYPPTSITKLRDGNMAKVGKDLGEGNEFNRGIECVYVALHLQGITTNVDLPSAALANTDGDVFPKNITVQDRIERMEIVDDWGIPLAYFSSADYKNPKAYAQIQEPLPPDGEGAVLEAKPWTRAKTGLFINPRSFQVFSAGPDGIFNTEDDIGNWVSDKHE